LSVSLFHLIHLSFLRCAVMRFDSFEMCRIFSAAIYYMLYIICMYYMKNLHPPLSLFTCI
jgi:hypothetical protein